MDRKRFTTAAERARREAPQQRNFGGAGYKLSDAQTAPGTSSEPLPGTVGEANPARTAGTTAEPINITFYADGFTVGDGPLRAMDAPESQAFLDALNKGFLPPELRGRAQANGQPVDVHLLDKKHEKYKPPPPPPMEAFSGSGQKLDDGAPAGAGEAKATGGEVVVDPSKPTTRLQLRMADGSRLVGKFNLDHTIQDVVNYIAAQRPGDAGGYDLLTGFPPAPLTDFAQTLEAAGLKNGSLTQKKR